MKKGTKIITTAIALVLVMSFMVVGILAATSATTNISSSISWTTTTGIGFDFKCGVMGTEADYNSSGATSWEDYMGDTYNNYIKFDDYEMSVRTDTTNNSANGSKTINATFFDNTDDGVNNPSSIIYGYYMVNKCSTAYAEFNYEEYTAEYFGQSVEVVATLTKYPVSNDYVDVKYVSETYLDIYWEYTSMSYHLQYATINDILQATGSLTPRESYSFSTGDGVNIGEYGEEGCAIYIVLTLKDPNQSLASFDAGVSFSFTRGNIVNYS